MESELSVWLDAQCSGTPGVSAALIVLGKSSAGPFAPVAVWPRPQDPPAPALVGAAQIAISTARSAQRQTKGAPDRTPEDVVAVPILAEGRAVGAVAVCMTSQTGRRSEEMAEELERRLRSLPRAATMPTPSDQSVDTPRPRVPPSDRTASESTADPRAALLELAVTVLDCESFGEAAITLATELATKLRCERVSLGFLEGAEVELTALSHSARFDERTRLARDVAAAMQEATDQEAPVTYPPLRDDVLEISRAHADLCSAHASGAACTIPLLEGEEIVGALTLELPPARRLEPRVVAFAEQVAALLGPILNAKRREARSLWRVVWDSLDRERGRWLDRDEPGRRWLAGACAVLALAVAVVPGTYRISAPATLEGTVQRAVVAPIDGYIAESRARAGDVVRRGQVLGALDDTDLGLERRKWAGRRAQIQKEYRAAVAGHDRAQTRILRARLDQAEAEIALLDGQLARTQLLAPFAGVVAKGDLSRSLGSPVKRGEVLFEVAPLDSYRIVLEVDEREIAYAAAGQRGELTLSALPGSPLPLRVERITPIASTAEGRNFFRVEARLEAPSRELRPGMEGIGKIEVGSRSLIWIWTHSLFDWLRLAAWSWLP